MPVNTDTDGAQQGSTETRPSWWSLYFAFRGRINLKTYWLGGIIPGTAIALGGLCLVLVLVLVLVLRDYVIDPANVPLRIGILAWSLQIYLWLWGLWIIHALTVKRLHDTGRSAWNLLWLLVPLIGQIVVYLIFGTVPSTLGDNKYGPEPEPGIPYPPFSVE